MRGGVTVLACPSLTAPEPVLALARAVVARDGGRLILAHVLPSRPDLFDTPMFAHVVDDVVESRRRDTQAWLTALAPRDVATSVEVMEGDFSVRIVDGVVRWGVGLVVVRPEDAARLMDTAPCPVIAVPERGDAPAVVKTSPQRHRRATRTA
jgi:hypothetical protein